MAALVKVAMLCPFRARHCVLGSALLCSTASMTSQDRSECISPDVEGCDGPRSLPAEPPHSPALSMTTIAFLICKRRKLQPEATMSLIRGQLGPSLRARPTSGNDLHDDEETQLALLLDRLGEL